MTVTNIQVVERVSGAVLVAAFIGTGLLGQMTLDRWIAATGRKPVVPGRGKYQAYLRSVDRELPSQIKRRLAIYDYTGVAFLGGAALLLGLGFVEI